MSLETSNVDESLKRVRPNYKRRAKKQLTLKIGNKKSYIAEDIGSVEVSSEDSESEFEAESPNRLWQSYKRKAKCQLIPETSCTNGSHADDLEDESGVSSENLHILIYIHTFLNKFFKFL